MERAYDKVWKDVLWKFQKGGVTGCMYQSLKVVSSALPYSSSISATLSKICYAKSSMQRILSYVTQLSPKEQNANLHIHGQTLLAENTPTYLGVTFDKRQTWKKQTEKAELRAKVRLALMKKLAGITWGADNSTFRRLYTGTVRPVLKYGMTAWGTTAKSNWTDQQGSESS